ncbi:MAG: hypothetical protein LBT46_00310 [Planctomycetaceae bacterium]|jgi:hypothetical protein|nr:hypothetical protein [Planctomycetaceae bacterium]
MSTRWVVERTIGFASTAEFMPALRWRFGNERDEGIVGDGILYVLPFDTTNRFVL